jgi:hypothetical protein
VGEHPRFLIAFGILVLASCLIAVGLVIQTIALHPAPGGWL